MYFVYKDISSIVLTVCVLSVAFGSNVIITNYKASSVVTNAWPSMVVESIHGIDKLVCLVSFFCLSKLFHEILLQVQYSSVCLYSTAVPSHVFSSLFWPFKFFSHAFLLQVQCSSLCLYSTVVHCDAFVLLDRVCFKLDVTLNTSSPVSTATVDLMVDAMRNFGEGF